MTFLRFILIFVLFCLQLFVKTAHHIRNATEHSSRWIYCQNGNRRKQEKEQFCCEFCMNYIMCFVFTNYYFIVFVLVFRFATVADVETRDKMKVCVCVCFVSVLAVFCMSHIFLESRTNCTQETICCIITVLLECTDFGEHLPVVEYGSLAYVRRPVDVYPVS